MNYTPELGRAREPRKPGSGSVSGAVEVPFLLHRAGTSEAQRLAVLFLGYGVPIVTGVLVMKFRAEISPTQTCLIGLNAAYLANAGSCLPVYGQVPGGSMSKPGWLITLVIVWPMLLEIVWIFVHASRASKGSGRQVGVPVT